MGSEMCIRDRFVAAERIREKVPDVITLDVEMPRMDGITFLKRIMTQHPIPVVMCSSLTDRGSETALRALELGAAEVIRKPCLGVKRFLEESKVLICDAVSAPPQARVRHLPDRAGRGCPGGARRSGRATGAAPWPAITAPPAAFRPASRRGTRKPPRPGSGRRRRGGSETSPSTTTRFW